MKVSTTSLDQLAVQVQQTLFEYFYLHNKVHLEATFSSPRFCLPHPRILDSQDRNWARLEQKSDFVKSSARLGVSHKIQKNRDRSQERENRSVL